MGTLNEEIDHTWTRWWLRRFGAIKPSMPGVSAGGRMHLYKVFIYDRALDKCVGDPFHYPEEIEIAVAQLRQLRQREREPLDKCVFCDPYGEMPS